ncbi:MAG: extracellular solute-binding protein [Janthinobacterium lividum]
MWQTTIKKIFHIFIGLFLFVIFSTAYDSHAKVQETLNIYTSHGYLPPQIIAKFEKETGIKILVDFFDSDDVLEAKLLSGATGYDLVFPTAWPYVVRQVSAGFYQEIDFSKIPNAAGIDSFFRKSLEGSHQANRYAIPFLSGIVGFAYNIPHAEKQDPPLPLDSWAMFFDPKVIEKMASCGVVMLDDPTDVIVVAKLYLGIDPVSESKKDLQRVIELLQKVRPFIKRFDLSRSNDEIASGEMCLVQHWMGAIAGSYEHLDDQAKRSAIKLVIPKEGSVMWLDVMAIPKTASRPDLAYKFINFILAPENIALITNETYYANPISASLPFVDPHIKSNETLFPSAKTLDKIVLHKSFSPSYQKMMTRALTKIRSGR